MQSDVSHQTHQTAFKQRSKTCSVAVVAVNRSTHVQSTSDLRNAWIRNSYIKRRFCLQAIPAIGKQGPDKKLGFKKPRNSREVVGVLPCAVS
jgi:hypothetical protein